MAYPDLKGERDNSMPLKRWSAEASGLGCRGTRVIWRKLDCLNPNLQTMQRSVCRKDACDRHHALRRLSSLAVATFGVWRRCPVRAIKEMSGTPTSRSDVQQGRTRDQSSGREPQGDGVLVVVVGVASHQGGRESRPQGEGAQVTGRSSTGRYA